MRCFTGLVVAAAALTAAPAVAQDHAMHDDAAAVMVSAGFSTYAPATVTVLPGETIGWTNDSARAHTVTADDGRFDSGRLPSGARFATTVTTPGDVAYHCELHAGMVGTILARTVLLDEPGAAAAPRRPYPLSGRAAVAPGTTVAVQADVGSGFTEIARTTTDATGHFAVRVVPPGSGQLRAVAGDAISPAVPLRVLDRSVTVSLSRAGDRDTVRVRVSPPAPGSRVVLALAIPERFGWWPARSATLGARSEARLAVRVRRHLRARVVLTLADGATVLARSRTFHVGAGG